RHGRVASAIGSAIGGLGEGAKHHGEVERRIAAQSRHGNDQRKGFLGEVDGYLNAAGENGHEAVADTKQAQSCFDAKARGIRAVEIERAREARRRIRVSVEIDESHEALGRDNIGRSNRTGEIYSETES